MNNDPNELSLEERATNYETYKHIDLVIQLLVKIQVEIFKRISTHDRSKLAPPEVSVFTEFTSKLAGSTYGSEEYYERLKSMKPALDSHYDNNRHHPEHFPNGVDGMNLIDLVEMICDWKAASLRHDNGNINKSIEINTERFNLSPQLVKILENTVPLLYPSYNHVSQKHLNDYWHCFSCGAGGMEGNFCSMCGDRKWEWRDDRDDTPNPAE